ncbi:MIB1-like protein, partial [Mya arenaria]
MCQISQSSIICECARYLRAPESASVPNISELPVSAHVPDISELQYPRMCQISQSASIRPCASYLIAPVSAHLPDISELQNPPMCQISQSSSIHQCVGYLSAPISANVPDISELQYLRATVSTNVQYAPMFKKPHSFSLHSYLGYFIAPVYVHVLDTLKLQYALISWILHSSSIRPCSRYLIGPQATVYGCLSFCGYCTGVTSAGPSAFTVTAPTVAVTTQPPYRPLLIGDSVLRGRDWNHGIQDGNGPGTVVALGLGTVTVTWLAGGTYVYRNGKDGAYEVRLSPIGTTISTTVAPLSQMHIGATVVRGPDWTNGMMDGNGPGTVLGVSNTSKTVQVFWNKTQTSGTFNVGNGINEVQLIFPGAGSGTTMSPSVLVPQIQVGTTVIRGTDWIYGKQIPSPSKMLGEPRTFVALNLDGGGQGTVVAVDPVQGTATVLWKNTGARHTYRNGKDGKYDILPQFPATTTPRPFTTSGFPVLRPGDKVVRGPDWTWGDQPGRIGIMSIRCLGLAGTRYRDRREPTGLGRGAVVLHKPHRLIQDGRQWGSRPAAVHRAMAASHLYDRIHDGNGPGEVTGFPVPGWVNVKWDKTGATETYRYGPDAHDVQKLKPTTTTSTAPPVTTATVPLVTTATTPPVTTATTPPVTTSTATTTYPASFVGMRVVRGPDWQWDNQDGNGPGTVTSIPQPGWVNVKWDNNPLENAYRYGTAGKYDVQPTASATTAGHIDVTVTGSTTSGARVLHVGDTVVRGPDWKWADQDGNGPGTVTEVTVNPTRGYWIHVRWKAGYENDYRYGVDGFFDIQAQEQTSTAPTTAADPYAFSVGDVVVRGPNWSWGDQDGNSTGTVTSTATSGWVQVTWSANNYTNTYRNGLNGIHDVAPAQGNGLQQGFIQIGTRVVRGPAWHYGSQ